MGIECMEEPDSSELIEQDMVGNENPWNLASLIPAGTYKSTLDDWNADHSLPLKSEKDKEAKTLMTPWGIFGYLAMPLGVIAAGDGVTQQMD